jgi:hypothetical protein
MVPIPVRGDCAAEFKGAHPWLVGLGLGGGITAADDAAHSYFLWGVDVRYALTPWLSIGVGDLGVRVGSSMADGDYAALTATPLLELARYKPGEGTTQSDATFVDAGLTVQRLLGTELGAPTPLALTAAIGKRVGHRRPVSAVGPRRRDRAADRRSRDRRSTVGGLGGAVRATRRALERALLALAFTWAAPGLGASRH